MEFIRRDTRIDFLGLRNIALSASAVLILLCTASLVVQKLNFGIDFTGGTLVEVSYQETVDVTEVRRVLDDAGFNKSVVQYFGTARDILVRLPRVHVEVEVEPGTESDTTSDIASENESGEGVTDSDATEETNGTEKVEKTSAEAVVVTVVKSDVKPAGTAETTDTATRTDATSQSNALIDALRAPWGETLAPHSIVGARQQCLRTEAAVMQSAGSAEVAEPVKPVATSESAIGESTESVTTSETHDCQVQLRRVEFVGGRFGEELTEQGSLAMLYALIGILIYVAWRFQWRFALGAVVALVHDVVLTVGFFSLFGIEFSLPVLAAVLAVIGYSLNDTIVVFDRIRENFRKIRKGDSVSVMNISINQTLRRTLLTSATTLLVVFALLLLGGEVIKGFAIALLVGVVAGTYSSIFVASPTVLMLGVLREDLEVVKKEGASHDSLV